MLIPYLSRLVTLVVITSIVLLSLACGSDPSPFPDWDRQDLEQEVARLRTENLELQSEIEQIDRYRTLFYIMIGVTVAGCGIALLVGAAMGSKAKEKARESGISDD